VTGSDPTSNARQRRSWASMPWINVIAPIALLLVIGIAWHLVVVLFRVPRIVLPSPIMVVEAFWQQRWSLLSASWITFKASVAGLACSAVLGSAMAILFSQSAAIRIAMYPYIIFLQTVPIVAIAPLLIIWSGNNFRTIVLVATIISIFPVISNVTSGLLSVNENLRDLFRMQSASRWQILTKLRIPAALPQLILGLRVSSGLSVIGAIVAEFFVGNSGEYDGLGTYMTAMQATLRIPELMAALVACTLLGVLLFNTVNLFSATLLRRWIRSGGFESDR
jgi:NitT/TauT family transport system permease protein